MKTSFNSFKISKNNYFFIFAFILILCILFFIVKNKWFSESFLSTRDNEKINEILLTKEISYFEKIGKIIELNTKDIKDEDLKIIINKNLKIIVSTLHLYINSNNATLSTKNKELVNGIIATPGLSSYKDIYKIKLLKINDKGVNDIISSGEYVTIDSITNYVNAKI
jgi:hypothetical protein